MQSTNSAISDFQITPLSDRSVLVSFGNIIDPSINEKVLFLHRALLRSRFEGFVESVPAYASLAIFYDVPQIRRHAQSSAFAFVKKCLHQLLQQRYAASEPVDPITRIPVCYDAEFGIDIGKVAEGHRLTIDEVISLHTSVIYRVYMIGFMPGFAYMGTVTEKLITPRKDQPALYVPAGSVGIAGAQTGIYPIDSPGGWHIIGKTPLRLFDTNNLSPCLLSAGDQVQFVSIDKNEFKRTDVH
ncbi:MAG: 5-oxoprolinase subunit PxpB [Ferruginibacter sp.]